MNVTLRSSASVVVAVGLLLSGCSHDGPEESPANASPQDGDDSGESPRPSIPESTITQVPVGQWDEMVDAGMVRPECPIQSRSQLRRVELNFIDFDGAVNRGALVVNNDAAPSAQRIFDRLFHQGFPIHSMVGVEEFDGDVAASLEANNTSAFNCRRSDQINAPFEDSPHANGRAIDVNPVQNPWMDLRCDCWTPSAEHAERTPGPGKIVEGDPVWKLFDDEGWIWQNISVPDYMHFDTGYPSAPLDPR